MKFKATIIIFLILFSLPSLAQTPEQIIEKFFKEYDAEGSGVALDNLYSSNRWIINNSDGVINLKSRLAGFNEELVGKRFGQEKITERKIGKSFVLISYMVKFERQPLRFTFQFYKPKDTWITYSFKFDDEMDEEVELSAQIHLLDSTYKN